MHGTLYLSISALLLNVVRAKNLTIVVNGTASHTIPDTLFGLMFEDINHSGDGGLYAEMLQNRAFQQVTPGTSAALAAWSAVNGASLEVVNSTTPVSSALPNSLQVQIPSGKTGPVGVANSGYFGINVNESWTYNASVFFKFPEGSTFSGNLTASLVGSDGTVFGSSSQSLSAAALTNWTQFFVKIKPTASASSTNNTFQVTLDGEAASGETVFFSLFSLFPPTYKNRENGMRMDLAQVLADMKPGFFRFPGGNNLGQEISQRWVWNNTVGPLTDRPGRLGDWGYINTDGLGLKEYLDFIEDEGMQSIMAVWAGFSFGGTVPEDDLGPYIQAAIDQINFVIGDPSESAAAALRASLGHPEPYPLKWVEIGNEDFVGPKSYAAYRWPEFMGNLSKTFPNLQFLATTDTFNPILTPNPEIWDIHVYQTPTWFAQNSFIYDGFERNGTKYFEGEYASVAANKSGSSGCPSSNQLAFPYMSGSLGEAAFMTGFERNADIVFAAAYAPLLANINGSQSAVPSLINFEYVPGHGASQVYLSTSYYVQKLFSLSKGTEYLPSTLPSPNGSVFWSITRDNSKNVFIKVVNTASADSPVELKLPFQVSSQGTAEVISGDNCTSDTPSTPNAAVPKISTFPAAETFTYNSPGFSLSVLTLEME